MGHNKSPNSIPPSISSIRQIYAHIFVGLLSNPPLISNDTHLYVVALVNAAIAVKYHHIIFHYSYHAFSFCDCRSLLWNCCP